MIRTSVRIEQGLHFLNCSFESRVRITGGKFLKFTGMAGITQFEDTVTFDLLKHDEVKLPFFIWMHYFSVILELECDENAVLVFADGDIKTVFPIARISHVPQAVTIDEKSSFTILTNIKRPTGKGCIEPGTVTAGEEAFLTIQYTAGETDIEKGGSILILTPYSSWSEPGVDAHDDIKVHAKNAGTKFSAKLYPYPNFSGRGYLYEITVTEGKLTKDDTVMLRYRGKQGADRGIIPQSYIQNEMYFLCWEDSAGTGVYQPLPLSKCPKVTVNCGTAARFRIKCPQIMQTDESIEITVLALDTMYNPVCSFNGKVSLSINKINENVIVTSEIPFCSGKAKFSTEGLKAGLYCITVSGENCITENLIVKVTDTAVKRMYCGQIHGHTEVSDGAFSMDDYFTYGRDYGLLDFCAVSDHDWEIIGQPRNSTFGRFKKIEDTVRKYNADGSYSTLCGYEWMGTGGHMNVYFLNDQGNDIYTGSVSLYDNEKQYHRIDELLERYKGRNDVVVLPHFSHGFDWYAYDRDLQPAAEIYSQWGISESGGAMNKTAKGAIEHLHTGKKFGFIGGADSHNGMPGMTGLRSKYHILGCREGLACVYADTLTRADIFGAVKNRYVYATSGERILLEFFVNGIQMGGVLPISDEVQTISCEITAGGTRKIKSIEIISNGESVFTVNNPGMVYSDTVTIARNISDLVLNEYYYLRVTQENNEMAWSSPVFIEIGNI